LRISESLNNVIAMKDGKVQEITSGNNWGGCVRVLKNGAWGVSFTTNPGKMEDAGKSALKLANALDNDVKLADIEPTHDNVKSKAKLKLQDVSLDEKKETNVRCREGS